jgi:hypothetical protein
MRTRSEYQKFAEAWVSIALFALVVGVLMQFFMAAVDKGGWSSGEDDRAPMPLPPDSGITAKAYKVTQYTVLHDVDHSPLPILEPEVLARSRTDVGQ